MVVEQDEKNRTSRTPGILFVDIEGGWGGSSRSLFYFVKHLNRHQFRPIVVLGKRGPIEHAYRKEQVSTILLSPIPRTTAMQRRNVRALGLFAFQLAFLPRVLCGIRNLIKRHGVRIIHLNHESLFFLGLCMKSLFRTRVVYHVRTMLPGNTWAKVQMMIASHTADYMIFITENERARWRAVYPRSQKVPHSIIYNSAESGKAEHPHPRLHDVAGKFKILSLMTLSRRRGTDRIVDVCRLLKDRDERDMVFVICGKPESLSYQRLICEKIQRQELAQYFVFLGHQANPEAILAQCDLVLKPSREYNPWGRDIIEALATGKPVIAIGTYDRFVEDGVNGFLLAEFDPAKIAEKIVYLSKHREVVEKMKVANIKKARDLFDGPTNSAKLGAIYDSLIYSEEQF